MATAWSTRSASMSFTSTRSPETRTAGRHAGQSSVQRRAGRSDRRPGPKWGRLPARRSHMNPAASPRRRSQSDASSRRWGGAHVTWRIRANAAIAPPFEPRARAWAPAHCKHLCRRIVCFPGWVKSGPARRTQSRRKPANVSHINHPATRHATCLESLIHRGRHRPNRPGLRAEGSRHDADVAYRRLLA